MSDEWVRLRRGDDWGEAYYAPDPINERGFADASLGIRFREGELVPVRWPNGSETWERIAFQKTTVNVGDHGHSYDVDTTLVGMMLSARGVSRFVEISEVDVLLKWVEFGPTRGDGVEPRPDPAAILKRYVDAHPLNDADAKLLDGFIADRKKARRM